MTTIPRPQPLGAFPLPASLLLLVGGEEVESVRQGLLHGHLPEIWSAELEGQRLAYAGEFAAAADWFARLDEPWARYNVFVLDPERVTRPEAIAALGEEWRPLVDYVAYAIGLTAVPPAETGATGELAALILTAQAAAALENGNEDAAVTRLHAAADAARNVHPAYAGIVLSELAGRGHVLDAAEEAVSVLKGTDLTDAYAEALYQRAGLIHGLAIDGKRPLQEAITGYTEALKYLNERDQRSLFARVHANLGLALLAQPLQSANDGLRAGVAVQSLRTAARLLDPEAEAEEWAVANLNLANSLVYTQSAHQRDNVMEAVDIYERVARTRSVRKDPLGRARVLANQGNALAHLGLHDDARMRFDEANYLFASTGDEESAQIVRDLIEQLDHGTASDVRDGAPVEEGVGQ